MLVSATRNESMHKLLSTYFILFLFASVSAEAAMVRVVSVDDARTITIERNGARESIHIGGVAISDELRAHELLRWTLQPSSWVLVEPAGDGTFLVYRSPDALFINRELVLRGYARATLAGIEPDHTLAVTYLGDLIPTARRADPRTKDPARRTGSGTGPRSTRARSARTARPGGHAPD